MSSYLSLLGVSTIDNVVGNNINVQNVTTNSVTVSSLNAGLVSATSGGTLQNATVGNGLSFTGNTLNNTGVTSIVSGQTGPVYISTSSTGSVQIALPQNLTVGSSPNFTDIGIINNCIIGSTSNLNSLLAASAGFVVNAISDPPLSYDNTTSRYSIALTGSTGIDYSVIGNTGYITNKFMTGPTGPQGIQGLTGYTGPIGITGPSNLTISNLNVFGGVNAGISQTTATGCVGLGYRSLESLTSSLSNTAVGTDSLRVLTSTTVPGSNTAVGFASLSQCSTGVQNTAIGSGSGRNLTTGRFNTLVGMSAGLSLTTGDTNFHLGLNSGLSNRTSGDNISIGAYSMGKGTNFMTGPNGRNIGLGHYSAHSLQGSPSNNVAIGYQSLYNATDGVSDNICIGTNSGNSIVTNGGGNIAIGGSSLSTGGTLTNGQGLNIGLGLASNLYLSANASNNIGIGAYSNFNTSTGINNISIGPFTQALSATGCNNIVLSTNGTISVPISGRGDNTALIDSTNGLYYYSPATAYLTSTGLSNGRVQWVNSETNNPIKGFTFGNFGNGPNTVIVPDKQGLYQIDVSGCVLGSGSSIFGTWNNTNVRNYNTFLQSFSSGGIAYQMNFTVQSRPYTVVALSGFELQITGGTWYSGLPLTASVRFISL